MNPSTPKHARIWRAALVVSAVGLAVYLCALLGPPVATELLRSVADSIATRGEAMPSDAHVYTEVTFDWSEFPSRLLGYGGWYTCERIDEVVVGYYEVDLISRRVVSSGSESWSETPETPDPEPVVLWTDLVSVDETGSASFSGAVTAVETDTSRSLPRLTVLLDGDASREIVVTVPWDTLVTTVSGAPIGCAQFIASLDGSIPTAVAMEVRRIGGEPWTTRIELHE